MRIGIFSGSFDPIHCGHAMLANFVAQFTYLDEVWLMPTPLNPLKSGTKPAEFIDRFTMCEIVAAKCRNVKVSDFEGGLPLPTYTCRTLCELKKAYPEHEFTLIVGSDNWRIFERWKDAEKIIEEFGVLIYARPDYPVEGSLPQNVRMLENVPQMLISSSFVRSVITGNANLNYILDPDVFKYIKSKRLYE